MRRTNYPINDDPYSEPQQPWFRTDMRGPARRLSVATCLAVSLSEAKAQCYVEHNLDDTLLKAKIKAAQNWVEQRVDSLCILSATYDLPVEDWWEGPLQVLPWPLQAVSSVKYYDTNGTEQTLASTVYLVNTNGWQQPGTIERAPDESWPSIQGDRRLPITIRFNAGYLAPITAVAATDVITSTGRAFTDNEMVRFWNSGGASAALPAGLSADTDYWVRDASSQTFKVSDVPAGTAIDITSTGTGLSYAGTIPEELKEGLLKLVETWHSNRSASNAVSKELEEEVLGRLGYRGYR